MNKIKEYLIVLTIYLLLTLILTYPLIVHFTTHIAGNGGDGWQNVWNMWWMKKALMDMHTNPYYTDYLFQPTGSTLIFQTMNPFNAVLSIPLQYAFNLVITYNVIFVMSFMLCGFSMYLLALHITNNKFASLVAGFIFCFSPYHMAHGLGHLQLVSMQFIPLFILYLIKMTEEGGSDRHAITASVFLVLVALCDWYYLFFCFMFLALFVIHTAWMRRFDFKILVKRAAIVFALTFLALSPYFIAMIKEATTNIIIGAHSPENSPPNLLSFFIPNPILTIGRSVDFFRIASGSFIRNQLENSNYMGYCVLFLSLYAFIKLRKKNPIVNLLLLSGVIFFILSLGMHLHVGGKEFRNIPLPYNFLYKTVFFFKFTGVPARFDVMLVVSLSLLAALGLKELFVIRNWLKRRIVVGAGIFFIFIEYLAVPFGINFTGIPQFCRDMAKDPSDYTVIAVSNRSKALYYQTIHNKKMFGGYISRQPLHTEEYLKSMPVISDIIYNRYPMKIKGRLVSQADAEKLVRSIFKTLNIKYVLVLNKEKNRFLEGYQFKNIYKDNDLKVFIP